MLVRLILTDLDGTLVDTRKANYLAYKEVFRQLGFELSKDQYFAAFGLKIEDLIRQLDMLDTTEFLNNVKEKKRVIYPEYFTYLNVNIDLLHFIEQSKRSGIKTGLVSTAQRANVMSVLKYLGLEAFFDIVVSANDISPTKPSPKPYIYAMEQMNTAPNETIIFEDSPTGLTAAEASGATYFKIDPDAF